MIKHLFLWTIIVFFNLSLAQAGSVRGQVLNNQGGTALPYASVALLKQGSSEAYAGAIANEEGYFIIKNVAHGEYKALVSFLGFESTEINNITVNAEHSRINLGTVTLRPSAIGMKEVEVNASAQTVVHKIDRQSYRATDFETAQGGSAVDLLSKLPSISIDQDGQVSMRGTTDFMVYINGKPTQSKASMVLSQIPAHQIQHIDIITVPTSKYDAQGKGGIINISTQAQAMDGLSVLANGMIGGTPWSNFEDVYSHQALNNQRYNMGAQLLYSKNKLAINAAINLQHRNNKGIGIIDPYIYQQAGEVTNTYDGMYYVFDGEGSRPKWSGNMMVSAGGSYQLTKHSELAASYQYAKRESGRTANYRYEAYFTDDPEGIPMADLSSIYNPNDIHRDAYFSHFSVDYLLRLKANNKLSSAFTYESSNLEQTIDNKEYTYIGEQYYLNQSPDFHSFQSDQTPLDAYRLNIAYESKFANGTRLEMGTQAQWIRLDGDYAYDTIIGNAFWGDPNISSYDNTIGLQRDLYSVYADFTGSYGKLDYILGLRTEYLNQAMNVSSTAYFAYVYGYFDEVGNGRDFDQTRFEQTKLDLFPTLHLAYQWNEVSTWSLAAGRRINRPPAKDMAPFLYRRHQEIYEMGDPLLEPEYLLNAELNYQRKFGAHDLSLSGFYRGVDNAIYRVNRVAYDMGNPGGVLLRSYTNAGDQRALGLELGLNLDLINKVKLYAGATLYDFRVIADDELLGESRDSHSTNWNIKTNLNWHINKALKLNIDYSYQSGSVTPQGKSLQFEALNAALNFRPPKWQGWSFSAKILDLLNSNQAGGYTAAYEGDQILLRRDYIYDYEGQIIELGARYTFNSKSIKTPQKLIGLDYF